MNKKLPQITISIARGTDRGEVTSDLNSLSVGLGLFLAWFFLALLSTGCIHAFSEGAPEMFPVPGELVPLLNLAALLACAVFLLVAAFTNQRLLAFYVSRPAPVAATVLAVAGTALLCVPGGGALACCWAWRARWRWCCGEPRSRTIPSPPSCSTLFWPSRWPWLSPSCSYIGYRLRRPTS